MGRSSIPKPYYMVEIEVTGGIVVRYIVYKFVKLSKVSRSLTIKSITEGSIIPYYRL